MFLSRQIRDTMVDNVEFVKNLVEIIKNDSRLRQKTSNGNQKEDMCIDYSTCEGEIQVKFDPTKKITNVFFKNEIRERKQQYGK